MQKFDSLYLFSLHVSCVKLFYPDGLQCLSPEIGHGMAVVNFNSFTVTVYCMLVIYQKKLSMPFMNFDIHFKPGMPNFATSALLRCTEGA